MGTAAGAAKAAQKRRECAAERRALLQQSRPQLSVPSVTDAALPTATDGGPIAPMQAVPALDQAVTAMVPGAAVIADKIIRGEIKASPAVRGNLALRVLELAHKPVSRTPALPAGLVETLQALGRAIGARAPRTFEGGEVVAPAVVDAG